jgi:hypothetical protein
MIRDVYPGFLIHPGFRGQNQKAPDTRSRIRIRNTGTDLISPDQSVSPRWYLYFKSVRKHSSNLFKHFFFFTNITTGILPK